MVDKGKGKGKGKSKGRGLCMEVIVVIVGIIRELIILIRGKGIISIRVSHFRLISNKVMKWASLLSIIKIDYLSL